MTGQLRVTGGTLVRRRFAVPAEGVRPTPDRARESLFSAFSNEMRGARILDLFAGSGALGIEALSRGAERVVFVERDPKVFRVLRDNLEGLGLSPTSELLRVDARSALERLRGERFDFVFADPPYRDLVEPWLVEGARDLLAPGGYFLLERSVKAAFEVPSDFEVVWDRRFGDASLRVLALTTTLDGGAEPGPGPA